MLSLNKKPLVGMLAFLVVLFTMPLGHALMILMGYAFGEQYQYAAATLLGLIGFFLIIAGTKRDREIIATWLGFFGGILIWTGWVEFAYVYYGQHLSIQPLIENGEVVTKPEYLLMPSSIGLLLATYLYFFFDSGTHCRFVRWIHRKLRFKLGKTANGKKRNIAVITAIETIYVLWFFYLLLLITYDQGILGDRHPATYIIFVGSLLWSLYLFTRLTKISKIGYAVRYAIPTVVIFWNSVEILGRWGFFKEIWVHPGQYKLELALILAAFIGVTIMTLLTPRDRKSEQS